MRFRSLSAFVWAPGAFPLFVAIIIGLPCLISVQQPGSSLHIVDVLEEGSGLTYVEAKYGLYSTCWRSSNGTSGNSACLPPQTSYKGLYGYDVSFNLPASLTAPLVLVIPAFALSVISLCLLAIYEYSTHMVAAVSTLLALGLSAGAVGVNAELKDHLETQADNFDDDFYATVSFGPAFVLTVIQMVLLFITMIILFVTRHIYSAPPLPSINYEEARQQAWAAKLTSGTFAAPPPYAGSSENRRVDPEAYAMDDLVLESGEPARGDLKASLEHQNSRSPYSLGANGYGEVASSSTVFVPENGASDSRPRHVEDSHDHLVVR